MLRWHPDAAKELKPNKGRLLNEMEELSKRTIIVKSEQGAAPFMTAWSRPVRSRQARSISTPGMCAISICWARRYKSW